MAFLVRNYSNSQSKKETTKGDMKDICEVVSVLNCLFTVFQYMIPRTASETGRFKILHIHELGNSFPQDFVATENLTSVQGESAEVQGRDVH